jgi:hypothetical protein
VTGMDSKSIALCRLLISPKQSAHDVNWSFLNQSLAFVSFRDEMSRIISFRHC